MHMDTCGVGRSFQKVPSDILLASDNMKVSSPWSSVLGQGEDLVLSVRSLSLIYLVGAEAEWRSILVIDYCKNA